MNQPIRILLNGAKGRMGLAIVNVAASEKAVIAAGVDQGDNLAAHIAAADVVIDFSYHSATLAVAQLAKLARTKQFAEAKVLHDKLAEIFKTLFVEPNPVPVKHCMMRAGIIRSDEVRLPLCEMSEANRLLVEKVADSTLASLR